MTTNNKTIRVYELQLLDYIDNIMNYNWGKFHCPSFFGFWVSKGVRWLPLSLKCIKNTLVLFKGHVDAY